jgi:DNA-binding transcriptional regulator YiaG
MMHGGGSAMTQRELKRLRESLSLTCRECAELVGVTLVTWQRWEGQTSRANEIPDNLLELFRLKTGKENTDD